MAKQADDKSTPDLFNGAPVVLTSDEIRVKLKRSKMSVVELAKKLNLSRNYVYILIRDESLRADKIYYEYAIRYLIG